MNLRRIVTNIGACLGVTLIALSVPMINKGSEWFTVRFEYRFVLLGLLILPVLLWRTTWGLDARLPRLRLGTLHPFAGGPLGWRARLRDLPGVIRTVAAAMFILSLARPVLPVSPVDKFESGIDIIVVLDLSGSMKATMDSPVNQAPSPRGNQKLRPTRLDIAKETLKDFIANRKTDRIGAVVFGKNAYVLAPPTLDYQLLTTLVSQIELDMIDGTGTAIGEALGVAAARLRRSPAKSKAVILLTDGDSNAGSISPEYGAHLCKTVGGRVYTIQIGTGDDVDIQDGVDLFGNPRYVRAHFPVNPELLKKIASSTGGAAYVAGDSNALRQSMHNVLDQLEKTRFEAQATTYEDLFPLFLLPGTLLFAIEAALRAWLLKRFP